ncbi:MAG: cobyrinate a,c-diamide synthase [SAR324 cluster bacterium]|uniref:Cobyrinate a,c-diamide synthase n=1 Tax=SAR324 cluster bacterium TaxID=2024889 RepID=A0A432GND5_9DELT|nr:MAG: cobyrinate a,c-diamide synthase [SAR324 cluster bacterium]
MGLIVAGMHSSGGKTAVTSLLLAALRKRNFIVQPFKVGPDYIDPGFHFHYSAKHSINLDPWIMGREHILQAAKKFTENAFGIAEGVMGLFDGSDPTNDSGSTMEVARRLSWPILLVVPCQNSGRSITAAIQGFVAEAGGPEHFAGIILNQVNSESHADYLSKACASLQIPILGALPEIPELRWPERHLGLQPGVEQELPEANHLAELAGKYFDLKLLIKKFPVLSASAAPVKNLQSTKPKFSKRIAVAQDEAFHFYYVANLEWLREQGAEVITFSPLHDSQVPKNVDALILGGGFPEVFAEKISANKSMLSSIKKTVESGIPTYAECGGLMVLVEVLKLKSGQSLAMAGVVPGMVEMTKRLQYFGYCKIDLPKSGEVRGHEFHYSRWTEESTHANLWDVTRHSTGNSRREGYRTANLHASYVHLYFPQAAPLIREVLHLLPS